jgi:hypothetical protein
MVGTRMAVRPEELLAVLAPACTDRTQPHNELGQQLAQHLCAVQAECSCPDELAATAEQLDAWAKRILTARRLDEVFAR